MWFVLKFSFEYCELKTTMGYDTPIIIVLERVVFVR